MFRLSLIARFSITSLVLMAGLSVLLGWGLTRQFEQQAIEQQKQAVALLVPPVLGSYLTEDLLAKGAHDQSYQNIDSALSYLGGLGLVRVEVLNRQEVVVYSDDTSLIGKRLPLSGGLRDALDGATTGALSPPDPSTNVDERGYGALLEVFTPLYMPGKSEVAAVFHGYYDADDLQQRISYTNGFLWTGTGFGFFFLYTSLFITVYNASSKLTRQNEQNAHLYREAQIQLAERKKAEEAAQRQVERLAALRTIDLAITSTLDLHVTLDTILEQVCGQLRADAASILLLDGEATTLTFAAGRGFRSNAIARSRMRLGEGYAGRAALEKRVSGVVKMSQTGDLNRARLLAGEGFVSYYVVPLVAKGQVRGVLEVFQRAPLAPSEEWKGFIEALGGQAAIAIDNATLFDDLEQSNTHLALAYDLTLEGWSRALDLRDRETEGHTQRVTEVAVRLARVMGMSEAELLNVRRGALLHDIGKMGIPDAILLKPGPLTDEEWTIMRCHPVYAYELLSPVAFLRQALDIPYYHHEKWDGTGYPRGLKGEQIPLAARIFAVVDVWDALRSDRPYRAAWPEKKVLEHIVSLSATHFDPRVVDAFLRLE